jgi:uncharacterized protein (DUF927 family)
MNNPAPKYDFKGTAEAALAQAEAVLSHWLPNGKYYGHEYKSLNPTRADSRPGSFSINISSGKWADFATDDSGGDIVSLVAYLDGCTQSEAETRLADFLGLQREKCVTCVTSVTPNRNDNNCNNIKDAANVTRQEDMMRDMCDKPPVFTHHLYGKPAALWTYHYADGKPWFYVVRFDTPEGKQILPRSWDGNGWRWKGVPSPRPLYNLHKLTADTDSPVILTEGEKAAEAAAVMLPDSVVTTTPNGCKAPHKCDWSPLKGRNLYIWPDNDAAGEDFANKVAKLAYNAEAATVSILLVEQLPGLPDKGDAADVTIDSVKGLLADASVWRHMPKPAVLPDRYTLNDQGLFYSGVDRDGNDMPPEWVCSRLEITAMTRGADNDAWGRLLEFTDRDGYQHSWAMPLELLAGDGNEYRRMLLSLGLEISPAVRTRHRLTEYIQTAPIQKRARCVSKTGWHNGVFVLPDETLGDNNEQVILQTLHETAAMRTSGSLDGWRDTVGLYCQGNSRLTLAVSAAFAAPLIEITGDEAGGLNFQGQSSTGKTTALYAAVSVWGGPDYLQRWRATSNGLEAVANAHNDALLCLDELAQVEAREAGSVAYLLANGCGKQRARRDGLARPRATWRLLFLSAGEIGLAQHMTEAGRKARAGQEVRLADIPADAGSGYGLFENLHGYSNGAELSEAIKEAAHTHYGYPARRYLAALVDVCRDQLHDRLRAMRADFAAETLPVNADGQARRVCDRFALIASGGELATSMGLTGWPVEAAIKAARKCFAAWLDNRGGAGAQEEKTALAQVTAYFEKHGASRFTRLDCDETDEQRTINRAGFKRITINGTAEYFVLPQVWRTEVCAGLDARYVARVCLEAGLIKPDSEGRATSTHRLSDMGRRRCYHFINTGVDA